MKRQKFVHVCLVIFEWWTTASSNSSKEILFLQLNAGLLREFYLPWENWLFHVKNVLFFQYHRVCDPSLFHAMVAFYCGCSNMMPFSVANLKKRFEWFSTPKQGRSFSKQNPPSEMTILKDLYQFSQLDFLAVGNTDGNVGLLILSSNHFS